MSTAAPSNPALPVNPEDLIRGTRIDPARILPVQKRYSAQLYKAYRQVKGYVRETVEENDALGIRDSRTVDGLAANQPTGPVSTFPFPTDPEKREAFLRWLDHNLRTGTIEQVGHKPWIRGSYKRGILHADAAMRASGVAVPEEDLANIFNLPIHFDTVESVHLRTLEGLAGINTAVSAEVSRKLADGLVQGWNPRKTATEINRSVDAIGIKRARMLARTETQYAVNEATLNRFQQMGVGQVTILAEFTTAGDGRVCDICAGLEGTTYDLESAHGVIPVHPMCRCQWAPVRQSVGNARLQVRSSRRASSGANRQRRPKPKAGVGV